MGFKSQKGFTLIEMVMVIVILGIIIAMSSTLLTEGLDTFSEGEDIVNANWQGQLAIERMTRDILLVRSTQSISTMTATSFAFTDISGNTISYSLSGSSLNLTLNGNTAVLADGVQSLSFIYYDKNGAITASSTLVRLIRISLIITQNNVKYTLTTSINPRNLL